MPLFPWRRREAQTLSAFIDGELDDSEMAECGDRLILDEAFRRQRDRLERVAALARAALAPPRIPDSAAFADRVMEAIGRSGPERAGAPAPARSLVRPAILASVGIALTVGLTLAGLRRRGLV